VAGFDAFISYSRRASTTLATELQVAVEKFAKPFYRLRAVRVFRDDASMSANVALWSTIERGLTEAGWFILLASPAAAQSEYVAREVTWWREHKPTNRILIVLEEGVDIVWDRAADDFDFEVTDSLPRALAGAFAEEPRWIDLRWYEASGSLGAQDPRWMERVADVASAVRGAERDELIGENVRQHKRARLALRSGITLISLFLVASLVATYVALGQRAEATKQRDEANHQRDVATEQARIALARQLAAQAVSLAPTDLQTASLLAVQAYRTNPDDQQAQATLLQIASASPQLVRTLPVGATVTATATTPEGVVVTGDAKGRVIVWHGADSQTIATLPGQVRALAASDDASVIAATDGTTAIRWAGSASQLPGLEAPTAVAVSPDGASVAVAEDGHTTIWAGQGPAVRARTRFTTALTFGDVGLVAFSTTGHFALVDPVTGAVLRQGEHALGLRAPGVGVSGDGSTLVGAPGGAELPVWRDSAALESNASANAVASADVVSPDIVVSRTGGLVASVVDGFVDIASVRSPSDPFQRPKRLDGAGTPGGFGTMSFGGDRYLTSGNAGTAMVWDVDQLTRFGTTIRGDVPTPCTACGPGRVEISGDGAHALLSGVGLFDTGPTVVDLDTGTDTPIADNPSAYEAAAWASDGRVMAFRASDSSLVRVDPGTMDVTVVTRLPIDDSVLAMSATRDRVLLVTQSGLVYTVALSSGQTAMSDALAKDPRAAAAEYPRFAPDGSSVAVLGYDSESNQSVVLQLDLDTDTVVFDGPGVAMAYDGASRLHVFDGQHAGTVVDGELTDLVPAPGVAHSPPPSLSPDGSLLVANGRDGSDVELLDLTRGGSELGHFAVPQDNDIYPVSAFSPDGGTVVTAIPPVGNLGLPGTVLSFSLDPKDWITAACAVAARDLTEADWSRYGVGPAPDDLRCVQ
jgi:WD40 repeat protein